MLLRVAQRLFQQRGFAHTSLNDVVALAGGSKATLRKYYKNKAGLFSAVMEDVSSSFVANAHLRELKGEPEQVLRAFGETVLKFYLAEDSLACYRGVVAEGHGEPAMAQSFYRQGHQRVQAALAEQLASWHQSGRVASAHHLDDADLFLHLIRAGIYEQRLIGLRNSVSRQEVSARIARAVQLFLRGIGTVAQ
jgi:AcrR family transcriptional regulator